LDNRSSTSNSEVSHKRWDGFPIAGAMALLLVVFCDQLLLSSAFPWQAIAKEVGPVNSVYWGVSRDRVELQRLGEAPPDSVRIAVLGSSRGETGFDRAIAEEMAPRAVFAKLAHALQDPVTTHALIPDIIAAGVDVVVFAISHADTHRTIRLEPLPAKSTSRLGTIATLIQNPEFKLSAQNRISLFRVALSGGSNFYRFRDLLGRAGANVLRDLPLDERLNRKAGMLLRGPAALGFSAPSRLPKVIEVGLTAQLTPVQRSAVLQLPWFTEIRTGAHAKLQMKLIRESVAELTGEGIQVLIAECPIHPIGRILEESGTDEQFRIFAHGLADANAVWFMPLTEQPPYGIRDYDDVFHLNAKGSAKYTPAVVRQVGKILESKRLPKTETSSRSSREAR
jgi:hypothetical protein